MGYTESCFLKTQKLKLYNKIPNLLPKPKDSQTYKTLYLGAVPTDLPVILSNQTNSKFNFGENLTISHINNKIFLQNQLRMERTKAGVGWSQQPPKHIGY